MAKTSFLGETVPEIVVTPDGRLRAGGTIFPCTLGRAGIRPDKHEGDGATPAGRYPLRHCLYRGDRESPPLTSLPAMAITERSGWCDDPAHPRYNQPVGLPFPGSHEALWRDDHCYDLIVVIGYNDSPAIPGKGSAIFLHFQHDDGRPTAGCVALSATDMRQLLSLLSAETEIVIEAA